MEEGRKLEQAHTLYKQRLQNLPKIIKQLHEIVKTDEIINSLKDSTMEKYRIDRVNQLVVDVLNSEKEKMLIRVLEKYEQQSCKLKQQQEKFEALRTNSNKQSSYYDSWLDLKQKSEKEIMKCRLLLDEKTEIIQKLNKEIKQLKDKLNDRAAASPKRQPESCASCKKLAEELSQSESQLKITKQFVEKLKKDGESAVQLLNEKIKGLNQANQRLESELIKKPQTVLKQSKEDLNYKNENAKRNEKVEVMRRQIAYLQQQLIQVQRQFNTVKDIAMGGTAAQIKKLQNSHKKLKQFIVQSLRNMAKQNKNSAEKIAMKLLTEIGKNTQSLKPERLLSKLNHLDNELDYFIENQILVE